MGVRKSIGCVGFAFPRSRAGLSAAVRVLWPAASSFTSRWHPPRPAAANNYFGAIQQGEEEPAQLDVRVCQNGYIRATRRTNNANKAQSHF